MKFLSPEAFLFAATIPVVILFYLLKRRRTVKLVSSTLLWQKFLAETQANAPFQKLRLAQLTGLNGFAVVDFATRKEIRRIQNPDLPPGKSTVPEGSDPSHGMAVTPDGKTLVVCSRLNNYLYSYSLPDLKVIGSAELGGKGAGWVTLTPDGRSAYVANPVTNDVSVVDVASMKEVARIPVGFVPKRNATGLLQ